MLAVTWVDLCLLPAGRGELSQSQRHGCKELCHPGRVVAGEEDSILASEPPSALQKNPREDFWVGWVVFKDGVS